jgi:hypothetical protein
MARSQGEEGHVVSVTGQEGQNALVAVPMAGFPEGFQLPPGARVVLVRGPSGPAVRPLARAISGRVPPEAVEQRGEVPTGLGRRARMQDATVVGEQPSTERAGDEDVVWVVESTDPDAPDQVIAVRRGGAAGG